MRDVFSRKPRRVAAAFFSASIAGCAAGPWPLPSAEIRKPFSMTIQETDEKPPKMATISKALANYIEKVIEARGNKDTWSAGFSDTTFAGVLTSVAGGIAAKTSVINIGAVLAALGVTTDQHYATEKQSDAYKKAENRLNCIQTATLLVPDDFVNAAKSVTNDPAVQSAGLNAPTDLIYAVDGVRMSLLQELSGLRAPAPTQSDLQQFVNLYYNAHQIDSKKPLGAGSLALLGSSDAEMQANLTLVKSFKTDLAACSKILN